MAQRPGVAFRKHIIGSYRGAGWSRSGGLSQYRINAVLDDGPVDNRGERRRIHISLTVENARSLHGWLTQRLADEES